MNFQDLQKIPLYQGVEKVRFYQNLGFKKSAARKRTFGSGSLKATLPRAAVPLGTPEINYKLQYK
jgi:hypothetical protein